MYYVNSLTLNCSPLAPRSKTGIHPKSSTAAKMIETVSCIIDFVRFFIKDRLNFSGSF